MTDENMINDEELENVSGGGSSIFRRISDMFSPTGKFYCGQWVSFKRGSINVVGKIVHIDKHGKPIRYAVADRDNPSYIHWANESELCGIETPMN